MDDQELRVRCLELGASCNPMQVETVAGWMYEFVTGKRAQPLPTKLEAAPGMPRTVAVTTEEGGEWLPFPLRMENGRPSDIGHVHAIKFADGGIWDAVNGWRLKPCAFKPSGITWIDSDAF